MKTNREEKRYYALEKQIAKIDRQEPDTLKKLTGTLRAIKAAMPQPEYSDQAGEISYFKNIRPKYEALLIYTLKRHYFDTGLPVDTSAISAYIKTELIIIERFYTQHPLHYAYYKQSGHELDQLYFSTQQTESNLLPPETNCSYLFAKFRAYDRLKTEIQTYINNAPNKTGSQKPTLLSISVDQLGLLTRAADDARLILGRSFSAICRDLAPHISTQVKPQVSPASIRANAYTGETHDKQVTIQLLEKMIRLIREY